MSRDVYGKTAEYPFGRIAIPIDSEGKVTKPHVTVIFKLRCRMQGMEKDASAAIERIVAKTGCTHIVAMYQVMKERPEFGHKSSAQETEWFKKNYDLIDLENPRLQLIKNTKPPSIKKARKKQAQDQAKIDEIISELPERADTDEEMHWVTIHPANNRRLAEKNSKILISITEEDILSSTAGPCPSRYAAMLLIRFVNDPGSINKMIVARVQKEQRSKTSGGIAGGPSEFDHMDDLTDAHKYHENVARLARKESAKLNR